MTLTELEDLRKTPLKVGSFSVHTQSCERDVQGVSTASQAVYSHERRDGWMRARIDHREMLPVFSSKQDILKSFSDSSV
ncbi:hypothetical protein Hamer_G000528 [Homarus americanus]|uniref:Uncharacterized protein n=1 Tax=Homarus americanus TaxID=6706 RepID=A0A8J5TKX7_HOMAM|nr:hypothetical protein Hamer_G000528 [Homarus americanus]